MSTGTAPTIESLTGRFHDRLRWRHVLFLVPATLLVVVGLGGLLGVWVPKHGQPRIGTAGTRGGYTVLFGAAYVLGAMLMSYALARFEIDRAVRRLPLVLPLSLLMLAAAILLQVFENLLGDHPAEGGGSGQERKSDRPVGEDTKHADRAAWSLPAGSSTPTSRHVCLAGRCPTRTGFPRCLPSHSSPRHTLVRARRRRPASQR